jgi:hypothetical protein
VVRLGGNDSYGYHTGIQFYSCPMASDKFQLL